MKNTDILIIGGGIVGLSLAQALRDGPLRVLLIDRADLSLKPLTPETDQRVYAITRRSQNFFQKNNIWDAIKNTRISPYQKMHVWDGTGNGEITFDCQDVAESNLGHIIEDKVMKHALLSALQDAPQVRLQTPCELTNLTREDDGWHVTTAAGDAIRARCVVAADGALSWVRNHLKLSTKVASYDQQAIVATVTTTKPHEATARQIFNSTGPLAFLPLSDPHQCSIVWSQDNAVAEDLMKLDKPDFEKQLTKAFANTLGEVSLLSDRFKFPLCMRHVNHYVDEGLVLIGDAAHSIHPLAGLGMNLGLSDVAMLAEHWLTAKPETFFQKTSLRRYERSRKTEVTMVIALMRGFKQLFGEQHPAIQWLRNWGLNTTDGMGMVKRQFMRFAMQGVK
jgi:2-polyprenylphenol 6-hydroxylase